MYVTDAFSYTSGQCYPDCLSSNSQYEVIAYLSWYDISALITIQGEGPKLTDDNQGVVKPRQLCCTCFLWVCHFRTYHKLDVFHRATNFMFGGSLSSGPGVN